MPSIEKKKILVHACCAACASYVQMELEKENFEVHFYFYNPNFNHLDYHFRLTGMRGLSDLKETKIIVPEYDESIYLDQIAPYQDKGSIKYINDKERFARKVREIMIDLLMSKSIEYASKSKYPFITTSMLCSPYRDHNTVWDVGNKLIEGKKPEFYYKDFRKGYWMGRNFARKYSLSIPAYCSDYME